MLKAIQKLFNPAPADPVAKATQQEEDASMSKQEGQSSAGDINTAELQAQLASATEALSGAQASMTELTAKYEQAQAALAAIEADKAQMVADAKAKTQATRQEKLAAVMGDIKAASTAAALETLDDATFETVLGTYAASYEAEKASPMFTEKGVAAEVPAQAAQPDAVQKLAAALAAQFNVK